MATALTSHGPKQVASGWHCCSKLPVLSETPDGQSLRGLNICSTCRRGEVVEWHTMLQLLLRVSFSRERASSLLRPCTLTANYFSLAPLLSSVSALPILLPSSPIILLYRFTAENCPGKFNELDFRSSIDSKTAHVFVQLRVWVSFTVQLFLQKQPREGTVMLLKLFSPRRRL